jgi:hypothetical protein
LGRAKDGKRAKLKGVIDVGKERWPRGMWVA